MTQQEFKNSLGNTSPPEKLPPLLEALWYDATGNWHKAHEVAQDIESPSGSWVHAYLHRKEGDASNAGYWYRKARRSFPDSSLHDEWEEIVSTLLSSHQ